MERRKTRSERVQRVINQLKTEAIIIALGFNKLCNVKYDNGEKEEPRLIRKAIIHS